MASISRRPTVAASITALPRTKSTSTSSRPLSTLTLPPLHRTIPTLPSFSLRIPFSTASLSAIPSIPSILAGIWGSILRAVPKKKTSHMKKRHRQMAGKALKDVTEVVKCSGCGRPKRAHMLCPYCVQSIRHFFKTGESISKDKDRIEALRKWEEECYQRKKMGKKILPFKFEEKKALDVDADEAGPA